MARFITILLLLLSNFSPSLAQTTVSPPDLSAYTKSVNGNTPDGSGNIAIATTNFVSGFTSASPGLIANLLSTAACNSARLASYAVVSDLYNGATNTNEVLRCGLSGTTYYWRPQRTDFAATQAFTGGALALTPFVSPPVMYLTGITTTNGTITPSATNAYPGEQFTVVETGTIGALLSLQVTGLIGSVLNFLTGGVHTVTYSCNPSSVCGWQGT